MCWNITGDLVNRQSPLDALCATNQHVPSTPLVLVITAHPDDETIGMGAQFLWLRNTHVVHVTDSAPFNNYYIHAAGFTTRSAYADTRRSESLEALGIAGIPPSHIKCLGIVDQESSYQLEAVTTQLAATIEELSPDIIVTHPYEGGHPDHDATAFAVCAALKLVDPDHAGPALIEFTSYHLREGDRRTYAFLGQEAFTRTLYLSTAERALKSKMLSCYATQRAVLAAFPVSI